MKNIIIFCQSPSDIRHTLWLYEKNSKESRIYIYVVNVHNNYKFLKSLGLENCVINFFPYEHNLRNPLGILKEKIYLIKAFKEHFKNIKVSDIYFFSHYFDYITFFFIKRLAQTNVIFFIDVFKVNREKVERLNIKDILKLLILYFITGISFICTGEDEKKVVTFPYEHYGVKKIEPKIDMSFIKKYSYKLKTDKIKSILFFESNGVMEDCYLDYRETLTQILIDLLANNYCIFIKPHPKKGYSNFISNLHVNMVEGYIPAEFIDLSTVNFVMGIESVGIANIARVENIPVFSIIDLFRFKNSDLKLSFKDYLKANSAEKIRFIDSYELLLKLFHKV